MNQVAKQAYIIINDVLSKINKTIEVDSYDTVSANVFKINSCDTKWATIGFNITIGAISYKITDIDPNVSITISGASLPAASSFELYAPKYFQGTIRSTSAEFKNKNLASERLPFAWLHQMTRERVNRNPLKRLDRECDCDIYFLTDFDLKWDNDTICKKAVQPMRNLASEFILSAEKNMYLMKKDDGLQFDQFDHAKFGVYISEQGKTDNIFDQYLSGTQLRITLPFLKIQSCCS